MEQVKFKQMKDGDKEDYTFFDTLERQYCEGTADRLMGAMESLDKTFRGIKSPD